MGVMKAGGTIPQALNCLGTGRKKRLLPHSNKFECQGETGPVCSGAISLLWAGMELFPCAKGRKAVSPYATRRQAVPRVPKCWSRPSFGGAFSLVPSRRRGRLFKVEHR